MGRAGPPPTQRDMDRSKHTEDPEAVANRWFPEMAPIPRSLGAIASRMATGAKVSRDAIFVDAERRFTLAHESGSDPKWVVRDNLTKVGVSVPVISQARSIVDELTKMTALTSDAAQRGGVPERVMLTPTPEGLTGGLFIATVEYGDGSVSPLGLFAAMDRELIGKLLELCGLPRNVPSQIGGRNA